MLTLTLLNNGVAFFFGGLRRREQFYNSSVATCFSGLLSVSITSFVLPTASYYMSDTSIRVLSGQSRGMTIILVVVYVAYLYFEFSTHKDIFNEESQKVAMRPRKTQVSHGAIMKGLVSADRIGTGPSRADVDDPAPNDRMIRLEFEDKDDEVEPELHLYVCIAVLIVGTTILGFNSKFMTDSIGASSLKPASPRTSSAWSSSLSSAMT